MAGKKGRSGRPRGAKDKNPRSPARVAANRANARKPRIRIPEEVRRTLEEAKRETAALIAGPGSKRLNQWISDPNSTDEQFTWAMTYGGDRAGYPRRSELDVEASGTAPLLVEVRGGLGWPGVGNRDVGGGGDSSSTRDGDG